MLHHNGLPVSVGAFLFGIASIGGAASEEFFPIVSGDGSIASAQLVLPTARYDHFVQGRNFEAGGLEVRLASGETLVLALPEDLVFEDTAPRIGDLDGDGSDEIAVVLSSIWKGAAIAVYSASKHGIALLAQTAFVGQPHRWRNIAGLGDFDGDGQLDIASVAMPHLVKRLEIHTLHGDRLDLIGQADGFSNHKFGSVHTAMAVVADFDGDDSADLVLPDADRSALKLVRFKDREFDIRATPALPDKADGTMFLDENGWIGLGFENGQRMALSPEAFTLSIPSGS